MRRLVIGTAGHIDHGKSALVRALTGIEPDRLREERERGITIDLGFAHTRVGDVTLAFVDVPGHERFVRNMLAGATGIDAALFVVAADESVMPQTREHLDICQLLEVQTGVIALTKADLADAEMRELAREETRELVRGTFLADAPIVEVSSTTGEGLDALRVALTALASTVSARPADGPVRLPIDRAFTLRGFGAVVTGTLTSGVLRARDALTLLPQGLPARVRGLHVHGCAVDEAQAGQRVAVNVGDVSLETMSRGDTLARDGALDPTRCLDVRLEMLAAAAPLRHGARVRFHQGTNEVMARVSLALGASAAPGSRQPARIRLERPVVVTRGDRFVLRSYSPLATIGGGLVLDPAPRRTGLRNAASLARLAQLDPPPGEARARTSQVRALQAMVAGEAAGVARSRLVIRLGVTSAALDDMLQAEAASNTLVCVADRVVAPEVWQAARRSLAELVRAHLAATPTSEGLPREEARDRLRLEPRVFDVLVEEAERAGLVSGRERLTLPGRDTSAADAEAAAASIAVEAVLTKHGLAPLELGELATEAGVDPSAAERAVSRLARDKRTVRIAGLWFARSAIDTLIADVKNLKASGGGDARLDVATFKTRYGLSRKFAIPLLEFLDRERVTKRVGDVRVVL